MQRVRIGASEAARRIPNEQNAPTSGITRDPGETHGAGMDECRISMHGDGKLRHHAKLPVMAGPGEVAGGSSVAPTAPEGWEGADEGGRAALIASATWSLTMPRTSSSLTPGIAADEETGGRQRGTVGTADDGPGDSEEGSIVDRRLRRWRTTRIRGGYATRSASKSRIDAITKDKLEKATNAVANQSPHVYKQLHMRTATAKHDDVIA